MLTTKPAVAAPRPRSPTRKNSPPAAAPVGVALFSLIARTSLMPSWKRPSAVCGDSSSSSASMVMAPVGQRSAHRPQRMHRSSSLTIAPAAASAPSASRKRVELGRARAGATTGTRARQASGQISTQPLHRMQRSESKTVSTLHHRQRDPSRRACASP